jgi:hypothetical protein
VSNTTCIQDPRRLERHAREVERTNETARKITSDAREALDGGIVNQEVYERICEMAEVYRQSLLWLLNDIYDVEAGK